MDSPFAATTTTTLQADTSAFQREMQQATRTNQEFGNELMRTSAIGRQFGSAIGTAFEGLALKGKSLGDTVRTLAQTLSQVAFKAAFKPLARGPDGRLGVALNGGGGVNVTFHVTATDVESFKRSETQVAALLARAVGRGQRNL